ncbi:MAG: hypothetical protein CVT86_04105 [Alphaproteobacteria bacterium HGW-Alphaproteobacteria-8]|nr:MAG: hypothetical protein CVT86_04105 [Alphaproteobacteria bacterium HGW-Alphaproteobacteria-8]
MTTSAAAPLIKKPRDLRLDFFRGIAMAIILIAHTPRNGWTLWIPARFGFSDATEIFVFCSGFASSLAFGATFTQRGWWIGAARIAHRVWQVYWAHIGVFLVTAALLMAIDLNGWGLEGKRYVTDPYVVPIFERTGPYLIGLFTLRYTPGLFDILPMYLVILAMTPVVMALHRAGGGAAVAAFVGVSWLSANLAGYAYVAGLDGWVWGEASLLHDGAMWLGAQVQFLNFPATPSGGGTWFFNPFGWQLVFFTGFAFGMGWLKPPPVSRGLVIAAAAVLLISIPFAWFRIHQGHYIPADWALTQAIAATREALSPLWWKQWQGAFRFVHFLAVAYLAWVAVGPRGVVLTQDLPIRLRPASRRAAMAMAAAAVALLTIPYALTAEIKAASPALDAWLLTVAPILSPALIGWLALLHFTALVTLAWNATPPGALRYITGPLWRASTPVVRKVGSQSLAVFMTSIPLSQINGLILDLIGRDIFRFAAVNLLGVAILVATAYLVGWMKSQPWRKTAEDSPAHRSVAPTPAE